MLNENWAIAIAQRLEVSLLQMQIQSLEALLAEHGVLLRPDDPRLGASGPEHLEQCRRVVRTAYDLLGELEALRRMVGSGMELLQEKSWLDT